MKKTLMCMLAMVVLPAWAESPAQVARAYVQEAGPGFSPSVERGAAFFRRDFGVSAKMPSCTACHGQKPEMSGRHVVTDKTIAPMALAANPDRFNDPKKVEKWFRRNCKEVVGRECSAAEKADVLAWLGARP